MLNYANLNDMEFEALCKDIMERMLGVSLRRFGPGKDGGVDLTDDVSTKAVVVQVKHYRKSPVDQLVRSLKNELPKVKILKPQKYYICCSSDLGVENVRALYEHFNAYMNSDRHIITLIEIDHFLHQEDNRDILKRHFKLWLDDTGLLEDVFGNELFVDCEVLLDDIEDQQKLFVQTKAFDQALNALEKQQILCIVGNPGVGKSITSKMLVMHYAAQGYHVRYTSDVTDLAALKNSISRDPDKKEIILLDDCFGQAYFEMRSEQSTALVYLIKYVKRKPSKTLILNSRVTIFHEAQQRQQSLSSSLDRNDFKVFLLDINNLSDVEKAKILYNHLSFSNIPDEYLEDIRKHHRYRTIVSHRNYNPRIIEFVCSPRRYRDVEPQHFFDFIMKHLDNPMEMWADEYDNRLQQTDRILLQTIYSLTTTTASYTLVQECFNRRISHIAGIDKTLNQFTNAFKRLNKGFIRFLDHNGKKELAMYNPSVNDFLDGRVSVGSLEHSELVQSICTFEQLRLLPEKERFHYISGILKSGAIENFIFPSLAYKNAVIGHSILASRLLLPQYRPTLLAYLADTHRLNHIRLTPLPTDINLAEAVLLPDIWEFYELKTFFEDGNHLYSLLSMWTLNDSIPFINKCDSLFHGTNRILYTQQVDLYLQEAIQDYCEIEADWYDVDIREAIDETADITPDGPIPDVNDATEYINDLVAGYAVDDLHDLFHSLPEHFYHLVERIDTDCISVSGADSLVEGYLYDGPDDYEPSYQEYQYDYSPIDAIFER